DADGRRLVRRVPAIPITARHACQAPPRQAAGRCGGARALRGGCVMLPGPPAPEEWGLAANEDTVRQAQPFRRSTTTPSAPPPCSPPTSDGQLPAMSRAAVPARPSGWARSSPPATRSPLGAGLRRDGLWSPQD